MFGAVVEGRAAANNDQPLSSNPYALGTDERLKWFAGWVEAHALASDDSSDTALVGGRH